MLQINYVHGLFYFTFKVNTYIDFILKYCFYVLLLVGFRPNINSITISYRLNE